MTAAFHENPAMLRDEATPPKATSSRVSLKKTKDRGSPRGSKTGRTAATPTASVNLLSGWVLDDLRVRQLRQRFVYGALTLVLVIGLAWALTSMMLSNSREELRGDDAVAEGLSSQIASLSEVRSYVSSVDLRALAVGGTMAGQVDFNAVLIELRENVPGDTKIETLQVTLPPPTPEAGAAPAGDEVDPCPGPDPFGITETAGCLQLSGTAANRESVSRLVLNLSRSNLFVEPFITTTTTNDSSRVTFQGSVGLTPQTYSDRFTALLDEGTAALIPGSKSASQSNSQSESEEGDN